MSGGAWGWGQIAILRLAKVVSPGWPLLGEWTQALMADEAIYPFTDMMLAPTPVALVAEAIALLLDEPTGGIFQMSGPRDVSYADVAFQLSAKLNIQPGLVQPIKATGQPAGAVVRHTTLDCSALRERFGIVVPDAWQVIDELLLDIPQKSA